MILNQQWVPNCDTLLSLIKTYREGRGIPVTIERNLIIRMASPNRPPQDVDFANLSIMQKVEVFEHALAGEFWLVPLSCLFLSLFFSSPLRSFPSRLAGFLECSLTILFAHSFFFPLSVPPVETTGKVLAKMLWLRSPSSEVWLERRTTYARSLALMSMVGYVLGLGDRHPSNLMLDRLSGQVVHIDFGDCFDVAVLRDKYPERVPFRLTRMLVNAMEVSGVEGTYRGVCESVLSVLRSNTDSVMTMLEAFVHDPLVNWEGIKTKEVDGVENDKDDGGSVPGAGKGSGNRNIQQEDEDSSDSSV